MAVDKTTNFNLHLPRFGQVTWHDDINENFQSIDSLITRYFQIANYTGVWQNSTAYAVGERTLDTEVSIIYECLVAHISAASPTTFAADRTAHAMYWTAYNLAPVNRGQWVTATTYNVNDAVTDADRYGICINAFTSDISYNVDVTNGNIVTMIDASATTAAAAASAVAANTSAGNAATSEINAATSETNAGTSETNAAASAVAAATSETNAGLSANAAATSANNAQAAAAAVFWEYDTTTTMADPGTGNIRLDNAIVASVTNIAVSALSASSGNPDVSDYVITWDDSTNTVKGHITIRESGAPATFVVFTVSGAITDNGTWLQIPVTYVSDAGTLAVSDDLYLSFYRAGNKGADGAGTVVSVTAGNGTITVAGTAADPTIAVTTGTTSGTIATGDHTHADLTKFNVSANDTTAGYLEDKLLVSGLAGLTTQNDGANETRTIDVPGASQAEAEAGTDNAKAMTALRTAQAITALQRTIASQVEAEAGTDNTKDMTALRVAQAIASQTGGTSENDRLFALSIAELKGDRYNMIDGIADPFADETDVATKTGATYDASGDYYHNTASGYGSNLFTTGNGSASSGTGTPGNLLDGDQATYWPGASAPQTWTYTFTGSGEVLTKFSLSNSSSSGNSGPGAFTFKASNTGAFAGEETTFLNLSGLSNWAIPETREYTFTNSTAYKYWQLIVTSVLGGPTLTLGEAMAYVTATPSNMTIVSSAFTADITPVTARLAVQAKPIDSITINTDLIGKVSRDNGTTWATATLVAVETLADTTTIYEDTAIDISAQPSGSSMKYRIETANTKQIQIHGVVLQWKD